MSDPKRATLITVGATKSEKNKVNKTVRLTINLVESNESKYPELNYKELVIAEERKHQVENGKNGKTDGLNPFSDNDDDVERVARKFEQKYGGKSTYGRKGRSKHDDFADIGAGYDENDPFIDNTDGYDEMIPPECDTLYGGFYINSGSLEFKNVDPPSDEEPRGRRNKRRISSSSSEDEESSDSSSCSAGGGGGGGGGASGGASGGGGGGAKQRDAPALVNGTHNTEHRKKKNKKIEKSKAKKIRRTDSSAATSGKQTSDENAAGFGESADSRTSQSDSLTSKPAPSSENPITSDSSRDAEAKVEVKLPAAVSSILEELQAAARSPADTHTQTHAHTHAHTHANSARRDLEPAEQLLVLRLERALSSCGAEKRVAAAAWTHAARSLRFSRTALLARARAHTQPARPQTHAHDTVAPPAASSVPPAPPAAPAPAPAHAPAPAPPAGGKRRAPDRGDDIDVTKLTDDEREAKIVETLQRLKDLIEERKPGMMANYNAECERVQEERKKLQIASAAEAGGGGVGGTVASGGECPKRLPKRRFPWCARSRALLGQLVRLARDPDAAALLLARRALPLFPAGFVRMPTLLRQADLSKEIKVSDIKRQRTNNSNSSQPYQVPVVPPAFIEPVHFPSSLTVTTMKPSPEKTETTIGTDDKEKSTSIFGNIINSFSLNKDLVVEKQEEKKPEEKKEDLYIPPNNIGSITITPVVNNQQKTEKKVNNNLVNDKQKDGLIRVKSPAALNEMVHKQEKNKALENIHKRDKEKHRKEKNHHSNDKTHLPKDKRVNSPLHIDTSYQPKQKEPTPSPKNKEEITKKQIESMRIAESNIPRPTLIPVHHSPTFAKPDKRPPEKKKKDLLIVSDVDPLADILTEPVAVDDSSSDVEVVEEKSDKASESETVPSKDKVSDREVNQGKDGGKSVEQDNEMDEATKEDFDAVMRNLRDLEQSREAPKFNSSYGGVITSAKRDKSSSQSFHSRAALFGDPQTDKDKLTNFFEQNGWM